MARGPASPSAARVRVWDRPVRLLHWLLVACVIAAWVTTMGSPSWHEPAGYAAAGVVFARVVWGLVGSRHARFANFIHGPAATIDHGARVLARREPRHLGHNPLGGWMVLALLGCVSGLGLTGLLYKHTDLFWGEAWLEAVHEALAWLLLALAILHVAGVAFTSVRHRENLVRAMVDGTKRPPSPGDID